MTTATAPIPVNFAGLTKAGKVPAWASRWKPGRTSVDEWLEHPSPGILVVGMSGLKDMARERERIGALAGHLMKAPCPVRVVLHFKKGGHTSGELFEAFGFFRGAISRVDVADGDDRLETTLNVAMAKCRAEEEERGADPLAEAREVIAVTETLLSKRGRLDAKAVADALGMPWCRLAVLLGSTKQAVGKTPDSPSLQASLRPYEQIARLRAVFPPKRFLAWMQRPNPHLDDHSPLQIIESGRARVVAELVESMLTGTPG